MGPNVRDISFREFGVTDIHPLALALTLAMGVWLLFARRTHAIVPLALVMCLIPVTQRLVVATLDFSMMRILILFGWTRLFLRGELRALRPNGLDWAVGLWVVSASLIYVIREGDFGAVVYRLGVIFDALGVYLMFRMLLRDRADLMRSLRSLAWIAIVVGTTMGLEWMTGRNVFAVFGGVPAETVVREGTLRCRGAFAHPIMAGTFGAVLAPLFLGLFLESGRRDRLPAVAFLAATVTTVTSGSSGPLLAYLAGLAFWAAWPLRDHLRALRWAAVIGGVVVHFAREKPLWHLLGRASDVFGGTGWHRYRLLDAFLRNFDGWWLVGTDDTAYWGWGLQDVTNQFVSNGVNGGLLTLAAFVAVLWLGFARIGRALPARIAGPRRPPQGFFVWGLGVSLGAHVVSFMGVTYFGQMDYVLYFTLALLASLRPLRSRARAAARATGRSRPAPVAPETAGPPALGASLGRTLGPRGRRLGAGPGGDRRPP